MAADQRTFGEGIVMTEAARSSRSKISVVISDVDGTLVTNEKLLTDATKAAVKALRERDIIFSVVSSRPPRGLRLLIEALGIAAPFGGFNGGVIAAPDFSAVRRHLLPPVIAKRAIDMLTAIGAQCWVFAGNDWLLRDATGPYVPLEQRTVAFPPAVVDDFTPFLDRIGKIVGVSTDFARLAQFETDLHAALADEASVARSQPQYLDVTHPLANKGAALLAIADLLSIRPSEIAVIGDGGNDVAMFEQAGFSIAMGNADAKVQSAADVVTKSNREDGFADAIERFILGRNGTIRANSARAGVQG
jgi:Cof subfamily protein (haloacid dehalogenase superfamily)